MGGLDASRYSVRVVQSVLGPYNASGVSVHARGTCDATIGCLRRVGCNKFAYFLRQTGWLNFYELGVQVPTGDLDV